MFEEEYILCPKVSLAQSSPGLCPSTDLFWWWPQNLKNHAEPVIPRRVAVSRR